MAVREPRTGRSNQTVRCVIYTRKSTNRGLDQDFNSLDAQREACEAYIASQRHEGWACMRSRYDDGGYSGGSMDRPALQRLLQDIEAGKVDAVIVYKIDRISRSLLDFAKLMEIFDRHNVTFTSITQQFSTATAMGRLTLNVLLSFAAFEREIAAERVKDKVDAAKKKGKYLGGTPPFGYDVDYNAKRLVVNQTEAKTVRWIYKRYIETQSLIGIAKELNAKGIMTKSWTTKNGTFHKGGPWNNQHIYRALNNKIHLGMVVHEGESYKGEHEAIVPQKLWDDVQAVLALGIHRRRNQETHETKAILRGIIKCGHCGKGMIGTYTKNRGRIYRYYICGSAAKSGYDTCPIRCISAGAIEDAVLTQLRHILASPEIVAQTYMILQDRMTADDDCEGMPTITEREVSEELRKLGPVWDELFPSEQQRIMRSLVEQVVVTQSGVDISLRAEGLYSVTSELM
ncbi:MAG: recombinase family protein [Armatimonadota bacterium]